MEKQVGQRIEFWHRLYDRTWGITWRYEIGTDRIIADYSRSQEIIVPNLIGNPATSRLQRIHFPSALGFDEGHGAINPVVQLPSTLTALDPVIGFSVRLFLDAEHIE